MKKIPVYLILSFAILLAGCKSPSAQSMPESNLSSVSSPESSQSSQSSSSDGSTPYPSHFEVIEGESSITLTVDYENNFSIKEEFRFEKDIFSKVKTYIILAESKSILEVSDYLKGAIRPSDCEDISDTKYLYISDNSFYLGDLGQVDYTTVLSKLKSLSKYKPNGESQPINEAGNSLLIHNFSKSTLLLEKTSMRVNVGDVKQIAIDQCPDGYADEIIFVSSNPQFAKVDKYGNVTGISNGVATINVSIHGAAVYQTILIYVV